jgi:hypothetical protein
MQYETVAEAYRDLEQASGRLVLVERLAALLATATGAGPAEVTALVHQTGDLGLAAEPTLSPNYSAAWRVIKPDAGLAMRWPPSDLHLVSTASPSSLHGPGPG